MFAYSREVMCDCYIKALFVHNCSHVKITSLVWSFFNIVSLLQQEFGVKHAIGIGKKSTLLKI